MHKGVNPFPTDFPFQFFPAFCRNTEEYLELNGLIRNGLITLKKKPKRVKSTTRHFFFIIYLFIIFFCTTLQYLDEFCEDVFKTFMTFFEAFKKERGLHNTTLAICVGIGQMPT